MSAAEAVQAVENVAKKLIGGGVDAKSLTERLALLQQDLYKFSDTLDKKLSSIGTIFFFFLRVMY
jgi:hypothetical protein